MSAGAIERGRLASILVRLFEMLTVIRIGLPDISAIVICRFESFQPSHAVLLFWRVR
jgi:hypothetical protein